MSLVVSISQRRVELRLYNLVYNLTISNPGLKVPDPAPDEGLDASRHALPVYFKTFGSLT
jgi:hypothetical protein